MRSLATRMAVFFAALFVGVQLTTMAGIYAVSSGHVLEHARQNLEYAERYCRIALVERSKRIADAARILVADFGFRTTIVDGDPATVQSALENLIMRIHAHRAFVVTPEGTVVADTDGFYRGQAFPFPDSLARASDMEADGAVTLGFLDGKLYALAVVPVLAPLPVGWVGVAVAFDRDLIEQLRIKSSQPLDITLATRSEQGARVLVSTLALGEQSSLSRALDRQPWTENTEPTLVSINDRSLVTLVRTLPAANAHQPLIEVLQLDYAEALRPFRWLLIGASLLLLVGVLVAVAGSVLVARRISEPVRKLAGASQRLIDGQPAEPVHDSGVDELGRLVETFRRASQIAAEMSELKRRDRRRRELVADVSHDLRSPLTSLHGYLETMRKQSDTLPLVEQQRYLDVALRQSRKVTQLAQAMFELARLECDETCAVREPFNLAELIQDVLQKYELRARQAKVRLGADCQAELPWVCGDIGLIERVLSNLLDNAVRHTPAGGHVLIRASSDGERARVKVIDNGVGMSPGQVTSLFDPEFRERRGVGAESGGMGLLIVRKILELHGSAIDVESAIGEGSVFRFCLPVVSGVRPRVGSARASV